MVMDEIDTCINNVSPCIASRVASPRIREVSFFYREGGGFVNFSSFVNF